MGCQQKSTDALTRYMYINTCIISILSIPFICYKNILFHNLWRMENCRWGYPCEFEKIKQPLFLIILHSTLAKCTSTCLFYTCMYHIRIVWICTKCVLFMWNTLMMAGGGRSILRVLSLPDNMEAISWQARALSRNTSFCVIRYPPGNNQFTVSKKPSQSQHMIPLLHVTWW